MVTYLSQADVVRGFEKIGVSPIERDMRQLRDLMAPTLNRHNSDEIIYKTVLANGTGNHVSTERMNAELERHAL